MKTAHILYSRYLDDSGERVTIGGVQTYITNLIGVFKDCGFKVSLYQCANRDYLVEHNGVKIHAINYSSVRGRRMGRKLLNECKKYINAKTDIVVFATDGLNVDCKGLKSISIQHGICWDMPKERYKSRARYFFEYVNKTRQAWNTITRCAKVDTLVCVDYNFVNWYRALTPFPKVNIIAIPNFTEIPKFKEKENEKPTIIFARRFFQYRGTRLFADAISLLLNEYEINIIVAGDGPDKPYLEAKLGNNKDVQFITYKSEESLRIHEKCDIAVIPTTGSEGTSLSLLEAMASSCAVICTNVGGMTNIVLDHFNGLIISPTVSQLYNALKELIENENLRIRLSRNAYNTVSTSFCLDKWKSEWKKIILNTMNPHEKD